MIIPLSNETLYFDWNIHLLNEKEVPFQVLIIDMDQKKEILTTAEELDAFCKEWNSNNPVKQFQIFTKLAMSDGNPVQRVADLRSILRTFWYVQPSYVIKKAGTNQLIQKGPVKW